MYRSDRASLYLRIANLESRRPIRPRGAPRARPPAAVPGATPAWAGAGAGVLRTHSHRQSHCGCAG